MIDVGNNLTNIDYIKFYNQLMIDKILKKIQVENGTITRKNGDSRYAVKITGKGTSIPNVKASEPNMNFRVGDNVLVQFPFGNQQLPRIIGYSDLSTGVEIIHNFTEANGSCFLSGTKILMTGGTLCNIENIKPKMEVLGFNEKTKKIIINKVKRLLIHGKPKELFKSYYHIKTDSNEVYVTYNHPFYIGDNKYENIENIKVNQIIYINYFGEIIKNKIISKKLIEVDVPVVTYNLELIGSHNYYANGFLVHNAGVK